MQFDSLSLAVFRGLVGESLDVDAEHPAVELSLTVVEARPLRDGSPDGVREGGSERSFSVLFRGPSTPALTQGIHRLRHAQIGPHDIFLVPLGTDPSGTTYEAVFNRMD